ncbi:MAG: flagellar basal body-associated FliL family protein [Thermodesulfobacteriota bacterium]
MPDAPKDPSPPSDRAAGNDADWESAFSAAEYLQAPDDQTSRPPQAGKTDSRSDPGPAIDGSADAAVPGGGRHRPLQGLLAGLGNAVYPWRLLPAGLCGRLSAVQRGAALLATLSLLIVAALAVIPGSDPPSVPPIAEEPVAPPAEPAAPAASPAGLAPLAGEAEDNPDAPAVPAIAEKQIILPPPGAAGSLDRDVGQYRKWRFPSFMISAESEDGSGAISYVVVDLSLLLPAGDGELPIEHQYAIRDFIYQFYANRPFFELKRFALARGEMKERLLAWLDKQWPAGRVQSILFHRYQIL